MTENDKKAIKVMREFNMLRVKMAGEIVRLRAVLSECEEYFDQQADADHNGISYIPNDEMRLLTEIREGRLWP